MSMVDFCVLYVCVLSLTLLADHWVFSEGSKGTRVFISSLVYLLLLFLIVVCTTM